MRARLVGLTLVFASLLFPWAGWAQHHDANSRPVTIRGQLRLPGNSPAGPGIPVTLILREGPFVAQTQTDSSGKFSFEQLGASIYRVKIHAPGYYDIESQDLDGNLIPTHYMQVDLRPLAGGTSTGPAPGSTISLAALNIPEGARKDVESGEQLLQKGDYANSIALFQKAIEAYPKYAEAYLMMGVAYRALNNLDEASAALRKCIEINPNSGLAYAALGEIQNHRTEYAEAEKTLVRAVTLSPESSQAQEELARAYWAQQRWQEAEPHAVKALSLAPNSPSAHLIMGNISLRKKDGAAALQQFREYLKLDPQGALAPSVREMVSKLEKALGQPVSE